MLRLRWMKWKGRYRYFLILLAWVYAVRQLRRHRRWYRGLYVTLYHALHHRLQVLRGRPVGVRATMIESAHVCRNGEECAVWWSSQEAMTGSSHVWVILPGGMTDGDRFYVRQAIDSGVLGTSFCVFHNPGIVTKCKAIHPPSLTDTTYLEDFILSLRRRAQVSLMGFSAGSMLAISMAHRADELMRSGATAAPAPAPADGHKKTRVLRSVVAVHGPDRIRDVFEEHQRHWSRLDIFFSLSLYTTMRNSGCSHVLSPSARSRLHDETLPWLQGWAFMKDYTQKVFQREWQDMEEQHWSIRSKANSALETKVCRILSENDPIIDFERCVDPSFFPNLSRVLVQKDGGHCAAFREPKVVHDVKAWCIAECGFQEDEFVS